MDENAANATEPEEVAYVPTRRKGIYVLPNLFTLAALFGGFYAVVMAMQGHFDQSAIGIFCAMVLDSLDGRVARMTNTQSAFGEQMDSLSDMVSFGAAPALVSYEWVLKGLGKWGWFAAFVYCACAALRLARFNVNTQLSINAISRAFRPRRLRLWWQALSGGAPIWVWPRRRWPGLCLPGCCTPALPW